jgi:hypothetical protein
MLFSMPLNDMKKSWGYGNSFPWLIMTMVIVAICMMEELTMKRQYGEAYDKYRDHTPFLFPLPAWLKKIFKAPMKLVTKSRFPENRRQIAGIIGTYTVIFMIISTIWIDFDHHDQLEVAAFENPYLVVDSLVDAIEHTKERRVLSGHFAALGKLDQNAVPPLLNYLTDPDPVKREFAANQLGHIKDTSAMWPLIEALDDPVWRIRRSTMNALTEIGDARAVQPIFDKMANAPKAQQADYFGIMAAFSVKEAWPYIVDGLQDEKWYQRNAAIQALVDIDADRALPYVYRMLEDTSYRIRRKAVYVLLDLKPHDAVVPLQQVLDDEDFETRFYARQTIRFIEDNKP